MWALPPEQKLKRLAVVEHQKHIEKVSLCVDKDLRTISVFDVAFH